MLKLNKHIYGVGGRYTQTKACQKCKCNRKNVLPPEIKFILLPNILSVKLLMHGFHKRCVYIYYMVVGFLQCKDIYIYTVCGPETNQTHPSSHRPLRFHTTTGWAPPNSVFLTWYGKWGDMYMYIYIYMQMYDMYIYIYKNVLYIYIYANVLNIYIYICRCIAISTTKF